MPSRYKVYLLKNLRPNSAHVFISICLVHFAKIFLIQKYLICNWLGVFKKMKGAYNRHQT